MTPEAIPDEEFACQGKPSGQEFKKSLPTSAAATANGYNIKQFVEKIRVCFFNFRCPLPRLVLSGELTRLRVDRAISQSNVRVTKYRRTHRLTGDVIFYISGYCIPWEGCLLRRLVHLNDLAVSIVPVGIV